MTSLELAIGYVAGFLGFINSVPQATKVWRSGSDAGVNVASWLIGFVAVSGWLGYGLRIGNPTIIAANIGVICTNGAVLIAIQRARGMRLTTGIPGLALMAGAAALAAFHMPLSILSTVFLLTSTVPWLQTMTSWRTLRDGSPSYVSRVTLTIRLISSVLWVWHGALIGDWTVIATASIGAVGTTLTIVMETQTARRRRAVELSAA